MPTSYRWGSLLRYRIKRLRNLVLCSLGSHIMMECGRTEAAAWGWCVREGCTEGWQLNNLSAFR